MSETEKAEVTQIADEVLAWSNAPNNAAPPSVTDNAYPEDGPLVRRIEQPSEVGQLIRLAIQAGQTPTELYAILREERARNAEMAYAKAKAAFQSTCPPIPQTSKASIVTKSGAKFAYTYADLTTIAQTVEPHLRLHGFSYDWNTEEDAKGKLWCVFNLRHSDGHSTPHRFPLVCESSSPGMSEADKYSGALTRARRMAMAQGLGITTGDPDELAENIEYITEAQQRTINDLLIEVDDSLRAEKKLPIDREKFLKFMGVEKLADIPASRFDTAIAALESKRKAKA